MTEFAATAAVPTAHASRYLQQLCKHWQHNLEVTFTETTAAIICPKDSRGADWPGDGKIRMTAQPLTLECRIEATAPEQLAGLKGALARHLDRFAFREAPLRFDWTAAK